jgi:hypothetical protein
MEQENKQWSITVHDTKINLTKDYLCDAYSKMNVDIMVLGTNQQRLLESNSFQPKEQEIGYYWYRGNCSCQVYSYKNSTSDDLQKRIDSKEASSESEVRSNVYSFTEPCVFITKDREPLYYVCRKKIKPQFFIKNATSISEYYYEDSPLKKYVCWEIAGEEAIQEASKDLKKYYKKVFKGINGSEEKRSVALPALGINIPNAPSIAVTSILKYLKKNKSRYDCIELILETDEEFNAYKELLEQDAMHNGVLHV